MTQYKGYGIEYMEHLDLYRFYPIKYPSWYGTFYRTLEETKSAIDRKQSTSRQTCLCML